jgi:cell wall-associated NlpC family hydrolase
MTMGATAALATVLIAFGHVGMGVSGGEQKINAVGDSLALLTARHQLATERPQGRPAAASSAPTEAEIAADPSKLPPASAGSNGTAVPHSSSLSRDAIFAHRRAGDPSNALLLTGVALAPPDAPEAVEGAINAANMIIGRPYIWGGGHASFYSNGYDCSGSVSFALFGGGLIPRPLTSGDLEHWGAPGPGKWITVYANAGHTFAEIAGLRWDTVGDEQGTGPRWHLAPTDTSGFVVRHPPGL